MSVFVLRSWLDMSPKTSPYEFLHVLINISAHIEPDGFSAAESGQFADITPFRLLNVRASPFIVAYSLHTVLLCQ